MNRSLLVSALYGLIHTRFMVDMAGMIFASSGGVNVLSRFNLKWIPAIFNRNVTQAELAHLCHRVAARILGLVASTGILVAAASCLLPAKPWRPARSSS